MSNINFQNIRQAEGLMEELQEVRSKIEERINLDKCSPNQKGVTINGNKIMRICLMAGLSSSDLRDLQEVETVQLSKANNRGFDSFFTTHNLSTIYSALLKLRYRTLSVDWDNAVLRSKIFNAEIIRGSNMLLNDAVLEEWLLNTVTFNGSNKAGRIPYPNLNIGVYEDDIQAKLNLNGKDITNTQIIVAGTTGSGKSNLLAVLLNEIRTLSIESPYPVNFLLFDYK